jgi:CRP-like cAMP-binding protein
VSRRNASERAFGKALALWEAPEGAGEARTCIASTFTFDASFFETECLGRFLAMDAHPAESDAVSYMVEREEKLAAARVAVLADRMHARDKESLRWDVLGVLVPRAKQHSKISLLTWANHVRVIVGSGNLTEPGYRKNLEVFGALDLSRKEGGDRETVVRVLNFLGELIDLAVGTDAPTAPKQRARDALRSVRALIARWPQIEADNPVLILGGPGRSIPNQLSEAWPTPLSPPRTASVVSPFFDADGTEAVSGLLKVLAKRRPREMHFDVRAEGRPDGRTRVFAPLPMVQLAATHADVTVRRILPEQNNEVRELHAKMICLQNDDWCVTLAGSSNFTSAGLGTDGRRANFEANLLYRHRLSHPDIKVLEKIWPATGEELDIRSDQLVWDPQGEDEEGGESSLPLPAAFEEASFVPGRPASLAITLRDPLPEAWNIQVPGGREVLSSARGTGAGEHIIGWESPDVPFVLEVVWTHAKGTAVANWPVNVSNPAALPPPEALRSLTLEELLQILASTRPMPQAVAEVLAKRKAKTAQADAELDPLRRFDSQSFLLRRTKRLAAALERLRERLDRPASSREAFEWRLFGPVGPLALAEGYAREASFAGEAKFCLAEIALTLHRVQADKVAADGLQRSEVSECLKRAIRQLTERAAQMPPVAELDRYASAAFEEAAR